MKPRHKFFRNQRYKNKLESKIEWKHLACGKYYYFITKEPDPRSLREWPFLPDRKAIGKDYYVYFYWNGRPETDYTIMQGQCHRRFPKYYRNYCNRRVRKTFKNEIYDHGLYKKLNEYWWTID